MKIIISHDVDHLYNKDHLFRDLFFPKLIVRSFVHVLQKKIKFRTFLWRVKSIFVNRLNRIEEVIKVDERNSVPSSFFFGMNQGLGMSYRPEEARKMIMYVKKKGFDVGVHGIDFESLEVMEKEYKSFEEINGTNMFGIRTHYVRYDEQTFEKLDKIGYLFDSSEFDKKGLVFKEPYKVGKMWEFPLHIMDGYILPFGNLNEGKKRTIDAIKKAENMKLPYCTILYHDYQYDEKTYPDEKEWYDWLLKYIKQNNYEIISYREAIRELEACYD